MRQTKLPISLLDEKAKNARVHILDTEPFDSVFGKKKTRKKPSLKVSEGSKLGCLEKKLFYELLINKDKGCFPGL